MTSFTRFFLADRSIPTIELSDGRMLILSHEGNWNEINPKEILSDEGSPEVSQSDLAKIINFLGHKFPDQSS